MRVLQLHWPNGRAVGLDNIARAAPLSLMPPLFWRDAVECESFAQRTAARWGTPITMWAVHPERTPLYVGRIEP